ncbi:hypothetical protein HY410_00920 [Candidatus Gottesmanbacteria bacterium]|nr:hypothetical protein [Candidatus Gottesmanbacteria bacterium]
MKSLLVGICILTISYWSIKPLVAQGWFSMHDDTQVGRVVAMGRALRNGQFPVRWVADLGYGYGYPLFNFYGPLPYWVGGAFYAIGLSGLTATKIMFTLGVVGAAITMFLFARQIVGTIAGLVAATAYLYAPYHAVQIYVRGAVGEFWVLVFLPLILLGVSKRDIIIGSIGLAGVILSHTILGYVTTLLLLVGIGLYGFGVLIRRSSPAGLGSLLTVLAMGLGLSMFFWLPAFAEMGFTAVGGQIGPTAFWGDHFVCISQLWHSDWGFGGSIPGCVDGISFKLGKVHILLAVLGIFAARKLRKSASFWIVAFVGGISVFLLTDWSAWVWRLVPNASYIQYPWRLLVYTILSLSIFVSVSVAIIRQKWMRVAFSFIIIFLIVAVNGKLFVPQYGYALDAAAFETDEELRYRISKISDEYLPIDVPRPTDISMVPKTTIRVPIDGSVETEIDTETYTKAMVTVRSQEPVTINRAHFPGWHYYIEGKEVGPILNHGLPTLVIPPGVYLFESRFTDTPVRTVGNIGSLITLVLIITFISGYERKANA